MNKLKLAPITLMSTALAFSGFSIGCEFEDPSSPDQDSDNVEQKQQQVPQEKPVPQRQEQEDLNRDESVPTWPQNDQQQ